jgi:integrase
VPDQDQPAALARFEGMSNAIALPTAAPVPENPYALYFVGQLVSDKSRRSMRSTLGQLLKRFFQWPGAAHAFPWHELRFKHLAALRTWLATTYAPATANRALVAVRGILRQAFRLGLIAEADYRLAVEVEAVRGSRTTPGRLVTVGEVRALFEAIRGHYPPALAARNAAMLALLYGAGLRRGELAGLTLASVSPQGLRLVGKGNKERLVPLPGGAVAALSAWCTVRGEAPGPLFWSACRGSKPQPGEPLTDGDIYAAVKRWGSLAGIPPLTPHDLRRSYVSELIDSGADFKVAADLCGHASIFTTARYDRRGDEARRRAADLVCVPFEAPAANP